MLYHSGKPKKKKSHCCFFIHFFVFLRLAKCVIAWLLTSVQSHFNRESYNLKCARRACIHVTFLVSGVCVLHTNIIRTYNRGNINLYIIEYIYKVSVCAQACDFVTLLNCYRSYFSLLYLASHLFLLPVANALQLLEITVPSKTRTAG